MLLAHVDQLGQRGLMDEADLQEVRGVHAQQHSRALGNRRRVVGRVGAIGRADFHELDPGLAHHIGDAKTAADLD